MKIVVKLGGFLFPTDVTHGKLKAFSETIQGLRKVGNQVVVVAGGGGNARKYIDAARGLGADEASCDQIGIYVTRLNAQLVITSLGGEAYPMVANTIEELKQFFATGKVTVMGGLQPGHSTAAVASIAAEAIGAEALINVTDVDGVYSGDPRKDKSAKKLDEISIAKLMDMAASQEVWAGEYRLIDPVAIKIVERSRVPTWFVSGGDPRNIEKAVRGEKIGTKVTF